MHSHLYINFYLRSSTRNPETGAIYVRITTNGVRQAIGAVTVVSGMSLPKSLMIQREHWDAKAGTVLPESPHCKELNEAIAECKKKLNRISLQHEALDLKLTTSSVKTAVTGGRVLPTIGDLVGRFIAEREALGAKKSTVDTYRHKFLTLLEFLKSEKAESTPAENFTKGSLVRYRTYMITQRNNAPRSADKACQFVKTLLIWAAENEIIRKNPLLYVRVRVDKTPNLVCLTQDEVQQVREATLIPELRKVADCFVFACYTGLAYQDLKNLTASSIQSVEGNQCIVGKRQKTGTDYCVPITPIVQELIDRYEGIKMPLPCNSEYNVLIKQVMLLVGIDKLITTHSARKTFADWCINELGMTEEATIVAMGQKCAKELTPYRKTRPKRLLSEFPKELLQPSAPERTSVCKPRPITGTPFFRVA